MGSHDGAETCEIVGCLILELLKEKLGHSIGLYRDDGLAIIEGTPRQIELTKKHICKTLKNLDLNITIEANKKVINYLDVTLNLNTGKHAPYMKNNNTIKYVNINSNHPRTILKNIPAGINQRLSNLSSDSEIFRESATPYQKALEESGYKYKLQYEPSTRNNSDAEKRPKRKRNITWFNPPFDLRVKTNIGKEFFKILKTAFPPSNKLNKIFTTNTIKMSYSCMPNVRSIINNHNQQTMKPTEPKTNYLMNDCKCKKSPCPLNNKCETKSIVYQATVTTDNRIEKYIGLCETSFKARYANHISSFKHRSKRTSTALSEFIWQLKDANKTYQIAWEIITKADTYNTATKRCKLCLAEKYTILFENERTTLNHRNELFSTCRHSSKFLLCHL